MEPLIFKIETQADDSGVRKYEKSLDGVNISSRKASGALKSFVQDIAQARDGTDVASAALGAFGRVLGSSLAGTGIIIAGKALIDAFSKIDEAVKESEKAVSEAFAGMEKAGKAMSFAEAVGQAKNFEGVAENIRKKIKEINDSPFTSIIDNITQSTKLMDIQATIAENQAREIKRVGAESELAHLKRMQGLDAENKALELNARSLEKELDGIDAIKESETALAITRKYQLQADEIRAKFADERNKQESENAAKRQKEIEAQIKAEKELAEAQQKRFNDLYNAEIKAQEETQKRIDANNKAEQEMVAKAASLAGDVATAKEEQLKQVGGSALEIARAGTGGSGSTSGRETSYERGVRLAGERAYKQGQRIEADRVKQETANIINAELAARGESRRVQPESTEVQNRLKQEFVKQRGTEGEASFGTKQAREATVQATQASSDFAEAQNKAGQASNSFESNLSDMGTGFDQATKSAENFASGVVENGGNMIDSFLKAGEQSGNLGDKLDNAGESVNKFSQEVEKATTPGGAGAAAGGGAGGKEDTGSLSSIQELLQKNFDELKTYAHAT
jgi:hypothetical protein